MTIAPLHKTSQIPPGPAPLSEETLIGLVTSRICHDLVSPIGAIDNGVELMTAISGAVHSAEMGLIGESARAAGLKLRLFRIAFGVSPADALSRTDDLRQVFEGSFNRGRLTFVWEGAPQAMPRAHAKLAALMLLCAESAMPFGGQLRMETANDRLTLNLLAERTRWQDHLWAGLTTNAGFTDVAAGEVHFPLARLQADQLHRAVIVDRHDTGVTLNV